MAKGITSTVQKELDVTSDHFPLLASVPDFLQCLPSPSKLRFGTIYEKVFQNLLSMQMQGLNTPVQRVALQIESRAEELIKFL